MKFKMPTKKRCLSNVILCTNLKSIRCNYQLKLNFGINQFRFMWKLENHLKPFNDTTCFKWKCEAIPFKIHIKMNGTILI